MTILPIFTYHAIGRSHSPVFTSPNALDSHLATLAGAGYQSLTLAGALAQRRDGRLQPKSVVITFDDGYQSVFEEALPRLQHYGFQATVFLITGYMGRTNRWPGQPPTVPERPLLTWEQANQLAAAGWELGAHTRSHPVLTHLTAAEVEDEILGSKAAVERETGQRPTTFAYPYGQTNEQITGLVREHFLGAAGTGLGLARPSGNPYNLDRIDAWYLHPTLISHLDGRPVQWYLTGRRWLRALRRRRQPDWNMGRR
jgi:peptidoglycan/xylan/chitin deacetylase (PgdA/CDA1 family)